MLLPGGLPTLTIGHLGGIPIRLDVSFVLVPLMMAGGMTAQNLAATAPQFAIGVAGIFLSILLHELGHALAARRHGIGTDEIVIGGFYGYARLMHRAPTRASAALVLLAGPLTNLALFGWLWMLLGGPGIDIGSLAIGRPEVRTTIYDYPLLTRAVRSLCWINLAMALFNMLPAFPLDGGRIYRHLLIDVISAQQATKLIAGLGMLVAAWCMLGGPRYGTVAFLIGVQLLLINIAIFTDPVRGEAD